MFEPLRLRAYLQTGMISDQYFPLEGVILYQKMREQFEEDRTTTVSNALNIDSGKADFSLPFATSVYEGKRIYHVSFAQWPKIVAEDFQNYAKRFDVGLSDVIDFKQRRGNVNTISGQYKNQFIKVYYRHAIYVDWYAKGDRAELERLLPHITNLGKKSAQGWGAVLRWEIIPIKKDYSIFNSEGKLVRSLPSQFGKFQYGYKAPFWVRDNQAMCEMPLT